MAVEDQELQAAGGESDDARAAHEAARQEQGTSPDESERAEPTSADDMQRHFDRPSHPGSGKGLDSLGGGTSGGGGLGGRAGQLISGGIGRLKRNKGKAGLIGGGALATVLVTATIFFGVAELKLIGVMKNVESHAFKIPQYTTNKRSSAWLKDAVNSRYFSKNGDKINVQGAPFHEQILQSLGAGMYKDLSAGGGNINVLNDPSHAGERIVEVVFADGSRQTYRTYYEKGEARSTLGLWVDQQTDDAGWIKRKWIKHRITNLTGTDWHWLDPIQQPYNKAKITMANQVAKFLLGSSSTASNLAATLLDNLLSGDDKQKLGDALQQASTEEANKILARELVEKISAATNGVGTAIAFLGLACGINHAIEDDTIHKIAQQKAEIEYMTEYAAKQSQANQQVEGKTNATAVGAATSLLVSAPDSSGKVHDITESNDIQRSSGNPVPYQPTNDCNSAKELCQSKLPANALNRTTVGEALQSSSDIHNSLAYRVLSMFLQTGSGGVLPAGVISIHDTCLIFGSVPVQAALGFGGTAVDAVLSHTPGISSIWGDIKSASQDAFNALLHTVIEPIVPPIVDANTVGPALGHALTIGGTLSASAEMGSNVGQESASDGQPCYQKSASDQASDDSMCAPPLSPGDAVVLNDAIQQDDLNNFKSSSWTTQLASLDTPYSALSRIVLRMPSTPGEMADNVGSTMAAAINPRSWMTAIAALPSIFTPLTEAGGPQSVNTYIVRDDGHGHAIDQFDNEYYGYTLGDLNKPAGSLPNADRNVGCAMTAKYRKAGGSDIPECDQFEQDSSGSAGSPPPSPTPSPTPGQLVFPVQGPVVPPSSWTQDQGVDISTTPNGTCGPAEPEVAIAGGEIVQEGITGFGDYAPVLHITDPGPLSGRYVYYGHAAPATVPVGATVTAGQKIAEVGCGIVGLSSGPHIEFGLYPTSGLNSFPSNGETSQEAYNLLLQAYNNGHR